MRDRPVRTVPHSRVHLRHVDVLARVGLLHDLKRRLRLIPAPAWLPDRYHSVRMTATHPVRRDRGTGTEGLQLFGRFPARTAA